MEGHGVRCDKRRVGREVYKNEETKISQSKDVKFTEVEVGSQGGGLLEYQVGVSAKESFRGRSLARRRYRTEDVRNGNSENEISYKD